MYGQYSGKKGRFFLELNQEADIVRGLSIEKNFASNSSTPKILGGHITGKMTEEIFTFQKVYFRSTGLKQLILFKAKVDFQKGIISGNWNHSTLEVSNAPDGKFQMFLDEGEFLKSSLGL